MLAGVWKTLLITSGAVLSTCFIVVSGLMKWRAGHVEWTTAGFLALFGTAFFAIRAYFLLRAEARRRFIRAELRRRRERIRALGAAVNELVQSMARLAPEDMSLFHSVLQTAGAYDTPCIMTTQGSSIHEVLVQMTDLKLATPRKFETVGFAPHTFTSVGYELTSFGRSYLSKLMPDVVNLRSILMNGIAHPDHR